MIPHLTDGQSRALALATDTDDIRPVLITGPGGTGKSFLIDRIDAEYRDPFTGDSALLKVAPTGMAALNIGAPTLHRAFGMRPGYTRGRRWAASFFDRIRALLIDEVSMVRADLLDDVDACLRRSWAEANYKPVAESPVFGGLKLIMVGDPFQLAPIVKDDERPALERKGYESEWFFDSNALAGGYVTCHLTEILRQADQDFRDLLERLRTGKMETPDYARLRGRVGRAQRGALTLCGRRAEADDINRRTLAKLPGDVLRSRAEITGEFNVQDAPVAEVLELKDRRSGDASVQLPGG